MTCQGTIQNVLLVTKLFHPRSGDKVIKTHFGLKKISPVVNLLVFNKNFILFQFLLTKKNVRMSIF